MLAPVTAAYAGIQNRAAQTIVRRAACQQVAGGLEAIVAGRRAGFGLYAAFEGGCVRDGTGHEIDDTAHVLRAVTHSTTATHHVDRVHVAHADRREGQLRLTIRCERHRDAVHQYGGA